MLRQEGLSRTESSAAATEPTLALMPSRNQLPATRPATTQAPSNTLSIWPLVAVSRMPLTRLSTRSRPAAVMKPVATSIGGSQTVFQSGRALTTASSAPV